MRKTLVIIFLIVATFLVYSQTFNHEWHFDDTVNITRNPRIHMTKFNWESLKNAMFAGGIRGDIYHPILYRPVSMMSFALNYYFHEKELPGYHAVNIAVHLITTVFLFLFILEFLRPRYPDKALIIAGLATILWSLNPVQLSNVTYIVQRQNALCGMFYIIALYFYITARKNRSTFRYIIAGFSILFSIGSKENGIMAIPSIVLFEAMFYGINRKKVMIFLYIVIVAIFAIVAVQGWETFTLEPLAKGFAKRDFTLGQRLLTESRVIVFYLMLLILPYHKLLSLTHTLPISKGLLSPPETLISLIIITAILAIAVINRKKHPLIAYSIFFFFINHIVESSFIPLELIFEHRNYIPSFLLFLPLAIAVVHINFKWLKRFASAAVAAFIIFFAYNTYEQNKVWATDLSLWYDVCTKSPDPRSVFNYAGSLYRQRRFREAVKYWQYSYRFNEIFGTNYSLDINSIPYGRVAYMGYRNFKKMSKFLTTDGWEDMEMADAWTIRNVPTKER